MHVEIFRLNESNRWELEEYKHTDNYIKINTIGESILLSEIYEGVNM